MRGRYDPHVYGNRPDGPQRHDRALLKTSQQPRLSLRRQLPNLIQKNRPPIGGPKEPQRIARRPGKRAAHMPEELRFQKGIPER